MKRRLILVAATFAGLLAMFLVYRMQTGRYVEPQDDFGQIPDGGPGEGGPDIADRLKGAEDPEYTSWDDDGRVRAIYRAKKFEKQEDGSYVMTEPIVEFRQRDGQRVYVTADRGAGYAEETPNGFNLRRGSLAGNVRIVLDRATQSDRRPWEERPADTIRIFVDDLKFDRELQTIRTPGPVTVFSNEADIYGRGLSIDWDEAPRELRLLRVEHGEHMSIYKVPGELEVITLPGRTLAGEAPPAKVPAPAKKPTPPAVKPPATSPASQPATAPTSRPAEPPQKNVYLAEFLGGDSDVRVDWGKGKLHGATRLSLTFDWDSKRRFDTQPLDEPAPATTKPSQPSTRPGEPKVIDVGEAPALPADEAAVAATQPATRPAGPEPLTVTWSGPLVIRPTGRTETPSDKRYRIFAEGDRVVLSDGQTTAECKQFAYRRPEETGELIGTAKQPATLELARGEKIFCEVMEFNRPAGTADLLGPGYMMRPYRAKATTQPATTKPATTKPAAETQPADVPADRIEWADGVAVVFDEVKVRGKSGKMRTRQVIREATFLQNVRLLQGKSGDFVKCHNLYVLMGLTQDGQVYPARAVATGDVTGRQEGSEIEAEKVTVSFDEMPVATTRPTPTSAEEADRRIRPSRLDAEGGVRVTDRRDKEPLVVTARRVTSNLVDRSAIVYGGKGAPARIVQGDNHIEGAEIRLAENAETAMVRGKGALEFLTNKDFSGTELSKPRHIRVVWTKGMDYRGGRNEVLFNGGVKLDSGLDHMECGRMRLVFERIAATTQPATQPTTAPAATTKPADEDKRLALGVEAYSRRRLAMILARDAVKLQSRRELKGVLERRLQLAGDELVYDARTGEMDMNGPGTLVAEDYRLPAKPTTQPAKPEVGQSPALQGPSQTAFAWKKSMRLSQTERVAVIEKDVTMVHRSGNEIVMADKLKVPYSIADLPDGRKTMLTCGEMMAKFGEPNDKPAQAATTQPAGAKPPAPTTKPVAATKPAATTKPADIWEAGPKLGPLELFKATHDVNLKDGPQQVLGQELIYDRARHVAIVLGWLPGQAKANAVIYYETPQRSQNWSSPKMTCFFDEQGEIIRVITEEVGGAGSTGP